MNNEIHKISFDKLVELFEQTQSSLRKQAARSVDIALVVRNWLFGWYIVEYEQNGADRVELYGKRLIKRLSCELTARLGKGFSKRSLEQFRRFYECYEKIAQTLSAQSFLANDKIRPILPVESFNSISHTLSGKLASCFKLGWSHYVILLTIKFSEERCFYEIEAIENSWSVRELKRQIESSLYERLALSRDKKRSKNFLKKVR